MIVNSTGLQGNNMDLDQASFYRYIQLHSCILSRSQVTCILSQPGDLVKIYFLAVLSTDFM